MRSSTRPRKTATRVKASVPVNTPTWMGLGPLYRKLVALAKSVAWLGSSGGAIRDV